MQLHSHHWAQATADTGRRKITLLHGLGGTGALFRPLAVSLEKEFDVLALDQRGHGSSLVETSEAAEGTHGATFAPLDFGQDVVETLRELKFHPTLLLGHSMGARSACAAASLAPDLFTGVVLVDLGLSGPAGGGLGETLATFIAVLPEGFSSHAEARTFLETQAPERSIGLYLLATLKRDASTGRMTFPFDHNSLIQTIRQSLSANARDLLYPFVLTGKPVLVLRGETSEVFPADAYAKEQQFFRDHPNVQFETFAGTGHGLPFEKRAELAERLKRFTI